MISGAREIFRTGKILKRLNLAGVFFQGLYFRHVKEKGQVCIFG